MLSARKPDHRGPVVVVGSCSLDAGLIKDTKGIPEELLGLIFLFMSELLLG